LSQTRRRRQIPSGGRGGGLSGRGGFTIAQRIGSEKLRIFSLKSLSSSDQCNSNHPYTRRKLCQKQDILRKERLTTPANRLQRTPSPDGSPIGMRVRAFKFDEPQHALVAIVDESDITGRLSIQSQRSNMQQERCYPPSNGPKSS
jgi:hypothetical protein